MTGRLGRPAPIPAAPDEAVLDRVPNPPTGPPHDGLWLPDQGVPACCGRG